MKKVILTALAVVSLAACGKETVREVLVTVPLTPSSTEAPATELNKFDQYLYSMYDSAAQSREWTDAELLEFGSIVCDSFDAGLSLSKVLSVFDQYSSGSYDDEFFVAVIGSAVMYLCPNHLSYVQSQI